MQLWLPTNEAPGMVGAVASTDGVEEQEFSNKSVEETSPAPPQMMPQDFKMACWLRRAL
jgi:hypothetical protein